MNPIYFLPLIMALLLIYLARQREKAILKQILNKKKAKDGQDMKELAKSFIDKECIIYTFNSQLTGVIRQVTEGALMVENGGTCEAVNLDFVVRIRQYPKKKNGKKKSVVID